MSQDTARVDFEELEFIFSLKSMHVLQKLEHTPSKTTSESGSAVAERKSVKAIKCTSCGHEMEAATPTVKLCFKSYFAGILEVRKVGLRELCGNNLGNFVAT